MAHKLYNFSTIIHSDITDVQNHTPIIIEKIILSTRIPGSALISILEHSVSQYDASDPDPGGRFLQLSGLTVTFDVRRPVGERVVTAKVSVTGEKASDNIAANAHACGGHVLHTRLYTI